MSWHVLTDGRLYWGQLWEMFNNSPRRPRSAMGGLQDATLCCGEGAIEEERRRAWDIMRVEVKPVPVKFVLVETRLVADKSSKSKKEWRVEVVT